jgi:4-azaleucine resistance transporter AzlC
MMPSEPSVQSEPSFWRDVRAGIVAIFPATAAAIPFGMVFGAAAAQKGLTAVEVGAFSTAVFAGAAQFLAVELWTDPAPWAALAFAVLLVNLRHILMSASLAPKLSDFPRWLRPVALFFMADEVWAMAEARAAEQRLTPAFYFGMAVLIGPSWIIFSVVGTYLGTYIADPKTYGFDIAFTAIFVALIAGFWRGASSAAVVAASAIVAVVVKLMVPGAWYVIAGALAGCAVAAALHRPALPAAPDSEPLP